MLDSKFIQSFLTVGVRVIVLDSISSTSDYLNRYINVPVACIAEHQTSGKGRNGNAWYSPYGENIYMSLKYNIGQVSEISLLPLIVGLSVLDVLRSISDKFMIKWPNDIYFENKKIAGILITRNEEDNASVVTIGIGVNINMKKCSYSNATSLRLITKKSHDRNLIIAHIINKLVFYLEKFKKEGFAVFKKEWMRYDYLYGKDVKVYSMKEAFYGKYMGIKEDGRIIVKLTTGIISSFSGDVSVSVI